MNIQITFRRCYLLGVCLCLAALGGALILEHAFKLEPCPLCILSRLVIIAMMVVFFVGSIHNPAGSGRWIYGLLNSILGIIGLGISSRHLWLQSLPPEQAPACGPGLSYLLDALPLLEALDLILKGSGECSKIQWQFLGMTLPAWTVVLLITLIGMSLWPLTKKNQE